MVTLIKYGASCNELVLFLEGLSTDTKPIEFFDVYDNNGTFITKKVIENGSKYTEIDTGKEFAYDAENETWYEVQTGGGGGIVLVGETTTALTDEATTNPIIVDGQSYTAQPNDAVIYGSKEFLFDGTKWHEFGDLSGLASKDIGAMTGYAKASTGSAIATTDTLNQAIGKVEKRVDVNENNISYYQENGSKNALDCTLKTLKTLNSTGWTDNVCNQNGVNYTVNNDGSITVSGTSAAGDSYFKLSGGVNIGDCKLTGCPSGGGSQRYMIYVSTPDKADTGSGNTYTGNSGEVYIIVRTAMGAVSNLVFKPMISPANMDNTYQQYAPSNAELYAMIQALQS